LLFFPSEFCEVASAFAWEWETSTLQRLGKTQALRVYIYIYTVDNRLFIDDYMGLGIITIHYRKSYLPANIKGRNVGF